MRAEPDTREEGGAEEARVDTHASAGKGKARAGAAAASAALTPREQAARLGISLTRKQRAQVELGVLRVEEVGAAK